MDDKIMKKVERLLTLASHPGTPPEEAQAAQEKADAIMIEYKIERANLNLDQEESVVRQNIVEREFTDLGIKIEAVGSARDFSSEYNVIGTIGGIRMNVFNHAGCHLWGRKLVGYEEDVIYAEFLWLCIFSEITSLMYPKWDDRLGFDENVYRIKTAGYSWSQVREMGLRKEAADKSGPLTAKNAGSKLRTAFRRHAGTIGQEVLPGRQQPSSPGLWRESFVQSFSTRMSQRFAAMKAKQEEYSSGSNLPALLRDEDILRKEFYDRIPEANPDNWEPVDTTPPAGRPRKSVRVRERRADMSAWNAGYNAASNVNLSRDSKIQNKKELS